MRNKPAGFILLPILLKDKRLAENPKEFVFTPNARHTEITDIEGCPAAWVRVKLIEHLRGLNDNVGGIIMQLRYLFTEDVIKRCFTLPNIWLLNHNIVARKKATYEMQMRNHMLKRVPKEELRLHADVDRRMQNRSVSSATRELRDLQRKQQPRVSTVDRTKTWSQFRSLCLEVEQRKGEQK